MDCMPDILNDMQQDTNTEAAQATIWVVFLFIQCFDAVLGDRKVSRPYNLSNP